MMMEECADSSWCEPLNLVKKKPTKPVAVVAPSSVVDNNSSVGGDRVKSEYDNSDNNSVIGNRTGVDSGSAKNSFRNVNSFHHKSEVMKQYADLMYEKEFMYSKNSSVSVEGKSNGILNLSIPTSSTPTPPEAVNGGFYSVFNNLANCEQSFLTALYMRNLMHMSLMAPPPPAPHGSALGMMGGSSAANHFISGGGAYPSSYFGGQYNSLVPSGLDESPVSFSPLIAQQRFWQMVSWGESQKNVHQLQQQQSAAKDLQSEPSSSVTESLSINVPSIDSTPIKQQGFTILKIPNSKDDFSNSVCDVTKPVCEKKVRNRSSSLDHKNSSSSANDASKTQDSGHTSNNQDKKKPHIKKPLNAFMLYMKEMRAKVVAECTLKESAAINQILGRRWHSLTREEQAKYYEKARQERQLHMELYPGWSARDNYGYGAKKKKRKKERVPISDCGGNSMKKCRARYGLDQQSQWCKPCRRKKKCIRYMECGDDGNQSEDNLGSCGSVGDAQTPPDDDGESFHQSMSSPGGLSGLSSLTSPSMILPSPSASLASPSVSLASPCMSLQSPLTPHALDFDCVGQNKSVVPPPPPPCLPLLINHHLAVVQPHRNPVGTNPHDINNPLSVNQLTGKCIKNSSSPSAGSSSATSSSKDSSSSSRPVISVT